MLNGSLTDNNKVVTDVVEAAYETLSTPMNQMKFDSAEGQGQLISTRKVKLSQVMDYVDDRETRIILGANKKAQMADESQERDFEI